jgi:CRP-like cAMP-binding protein
VYFVLEGPVEVRLSDTPERIFAIRVETREVGECLGEYGFVDQKPASAEVIATKPTTLSRISHETLRRLLRINSALETLVHRNLLRQLTDRLRGSNAELDLFRPV